MCVCVQGHRTSLDVTFHHRQEFPHPQTPHRGELTQRRLQQEERDPSKHQGQEVGDEEGPCHMTRSGHDKPGSKQYYTVQTLHRTSSKVKYVLLSTWGIYFCTNGCQIRFSVPQIHKHTHIHTHTHTLSHTPCQLQLMSEQSTGRLSHPLFRKSITFLTDKL